MEWNIKFKGDVISAMKFKRIKSSHCSLYHAAITSQKKPSVCLSQQDQKAFLCLRCWTRTAIFLLGLGQRIKYYAANISEIIPLAEKICRRLSRYSD